MLDPRIYRTGLVAVVLAVIVFAFSFRDQQGSLGATLAPDAFNGQNAFRDATNLAQHYPHRQAGSASDDAIAAEITQRLHANDFSVSNQAFQAPTPSGTRTLRNVIGVRSGSSSGSIVVIAHRDATGSPAKLEESGTGVLLDLARVLSGETLNHTIVLASTSGSTGAAGATNTVAGALSTQASLPAGGSSLMGQFAHLAFPFTVSEQGPFNARGIPAVLLSASGERTPAANAPLSLAQIGQFGRTAQEVISALDGGGPVPAPSAYLVMGGNVVPAWAVRLLVLGLILPVLGATIDAFARARRRGHPVGPWAARVLAAGVPLALGVAIVLFAKAVGLLQVAPPAAAAAGAVPLHTSGTALLVAIAGVIAIAFWLLRRTGVLVKASGDPGAAAALLIVMCALALAIWVTNPFAAALLVPALHLWMWVLMPQTRMHPALRGTLFVAGLAPPLLLLAYFMITLGYNPITFAWSGAMMIASGQISPLVALEWCAAAACALWGVAIAAWSARQEHPQEVPVTVRGPVTYAGPGSLGGTKSALRR
ncbi:MAG: hypothetical protein E6G05_06580 [Actinobacteria bacterium]|nr:MAG: hypothetical protein E6G05_06580 [Actinomycetota bacterium]